MEVTRFCWSSLQESSLKKKNIKLSLLFLCEVLVSLKAEDTPPKRWTNFKYTKWYTIHTLYPLKAMGMPHWWGRGGGGGGDSGGRRRSKVLPKTSLGRKPRLITYFLRDYLTKIPQPQHFQSWDCYQRHKRKFLMSFIRFFLHVMVSWVWLIIAPLCFLADVQLDLHLTSPQRLKLSQSWQPIFAVPANEGPSSE